ncbi:CONSERVED MEMBRANE PROTEIN [hydrothermal vent metagenome]|uniref:CONSERVED MEMBRANE PROTEIN n=1 Tax=hydrothermal vent metagenome TaxID=652676 RepID=A0A1W1CZU8_9ZZZZ
MQYLAILPLIAFLLMFWKGIAFLTLLTLIAILFSIIIYRHIKTKDLFAVPLVFTLIASFYFYGFYGLGNTQSPQTFHTLKNGQAISLFDFKKSVNIDKICYFVGIDKNVNFILEAQSPKGWQKFYDYKNHYPYSFSWQCINQNISTDKILWRITKNQMMLYEVRFSYQGKKIDYRSNRKYLKDEKNIRVDTRYYSGMIFDEIYFARTAYEIGKGISVYENTHPYLGKVLILLGIKGFGMTAFGWRFMGVLFAGFLIFMAYTFAYRLFKNHLYAFSSGFLMTYSFMHLAQSRIALVDTFGVFFIFVSYFYLYKFILAQQLPKLLLSGVFFGLAIAVKWSAIFASFGFVFMALYLIFSAYPLENRFKSWRLLAYGFLSYGVIGFSVYILSFWDILAEGGNLKSIFLYNLNMYHYHSTLDATHPYSSPWWSWILDMKPMGYYKVLEGGILHSLNTLGNPAIFWLGFVAIIYLLVSLLWRRSIEVILILSAFFSLYLPYAFVGRLMFIYHFYYAFPFLILAIVLMWRDMIERFAWAKYLLFIYLSLVALFFLGFYPILTATAIKLSYVKEYLIWFKGWWF